VVTAQTVDLRGMATLLLLASPPRATLRAVWGRERGRSIPFASVGAVERYV
jgi:hypothetical protein